MLKKFQTYQLNLAGRCHLFPSKYICRNNALKQGMNISQQNGKVTGTVVDDLGPVAGASVVVKRNNQWKHYRHGW